MKSFFQFLSEAQSQASMQAKKLNLKSDGHVLIHNFLELWQENLKQLWKISAWLKGRTEHD